MSENDQVTIPGAESHSLPDQGEERIPEQRMTVRAQAPGQDARDAIVNRHRDALKRSSPEIARIMGEATAKDVGEGYIAEDDDSALERAEEEEAERQAAEARAAGEAEGAYDPERYDQPPGESETEPEPDPYVVVKSYGRELTVPKADVDAAGGIKAYQYELAIRRETERGNFHRVEQLEHELAALRGRAPAPTQRPNGQAAPRAPATDADALIQRTLAEAQAARDRALEHERVLAGLRAQAEANLNQTQQPAAPAPPKSAPGGTVELTEDQRAVLDDMREKGFEDDIIETRRLAFETANQLQAGRPNPASAGDDAFVARVADQVTERQRLDAEKAFADQANAQFSNYADIRDNRELCVRAQVRFAETRERHPTMGAAAIVDHVCQGLRQELAGARRPNGPSRPNTTRKRASEARRPTAAARLPTEEPEPKPQTRSEAIAEMRAARPPQ